MNQASEFLNLCFDLKSKIFQDMIEYDAKVYNYTETQKFNIFEKNKGLDITSIPECYEKCK